MLRSTTIRFRKITSEDDLATFSELTQRYIDVKYPLEYLQRSRVVALVVENEWGEVERILGGYILALSHPFRVLEQIPQAIVENHSDLQQKWNDCLELTGLWIHPLVKCGQIRFRFWWKLFMDLSALSFQGKPYILYSYDASCKKLGEMYSLAKPSRIFEGEVFIPGMTAENTEIVEMGSTHAVMKAFFASPKDIAFFIGKRLFRKRRKFVNIQTEKHEEVLV